jgi:hypothetical protein
MRAPAHPGLYRGVLLLIGLENLGIRTALGTHGGR